MKQELENVVRRARACLANARKQSTEEGHWVTTDEGNHIFINGKGEVDMDGSRHTSSKRGSAPKRGGSFGRGKDVLNRLGGKAKPASTPKPAPKASPSAPKAAAPKAAATPKQYPRTIDYSEFQPDRYEFEDDLETLGPGSHADLEYMKPYAEKLGMMKQWEKTARDIGYNAVSETISRARKAVARRKSK